VRFCENEYPAGSTAKLYGPASKLHGFEATRWTIRQHCDLFSAASQHLPQKLAETSVEALVIDTHTQISLRDVYKESTTDMPKDEFMKWSLELPN
jgi:hypothetical protein